MLKRLVSAVHLLSLITAALLGFVTSEILIGPAQPALPGFDAGQPEQQELHLQPIAELAAAFEI